MGLLTNIWNNLGDVTSGKRNFASLFNGGVNTYPSPAPGFKSTISSSGSNPVNAFPVSSGVTLDQGKIATPATQPQTNPNIGKTYTINGTTYDVQGNVVSGAPAQNQNQMQAASQDTQMAQSPFNSSGSNSSGVPPVGTQTYKTGDGSVYDSNQNLVSQPGQNVTTNPGPNISAQTPSNTTNSTSLGQAPGNNSILGSLNNAYANEQNMFANLSQYSTVPPAEQEMQSQVAQDAAQVKGLQLQEQGLYNPGGQTIAMPFLSGQAQNQMVSAQLKQTIDQANLAYAQGNRQFAFNSASTIYNASRNNLVDMVSIYQASAPKNISTNYNPLTGAVNTTMINPLTGETYVVDNGNIGASTPLQNVTTQVNPLNGQLTTTGTNAAGKPVSYSMDSNGVITSTSGTGNPGPTNSLVSSNINPQAVVGGYDLTSYAGAGSATGNYGPTVNGIYNNMGQINNAQDAQSYINSVSKSSPITGDMVMNASAQYGVDPKVMMSVMQAESSMGTKGMATSTFNPGNVGNNSDSGKKTNWGSWQGGVNAVAQNLSKRQVSGASNQGTMVANGSSPQQVIQQVFGVKESISVVK